MDNKTFTKSMTILDAENIVKYYKDIRSNETTKNKFNVFSIFAQWNLKKNIDILSKEVSSFEELRDEKQKELNDKYFTDEKSESKEIEQVVDGEVKMVPGRQVKEEYLEDFKIEHSNMLTELYKVAMQKIDVELFVIDIDKELEDVKDADALQELNMDDLDFLSIFK